MKHAIIGLLGLAGLTFCASAALAADAAPCKLKVFATLDMNLNTPGRIIVPITVSGQTLPFMVDTGAPFTAIMEAAARKLGLQLDATTSRRVRTFDGTTLTYSAGAPSVMIGKLPLGNQFSFMVMPDSERFGADGLLGPDIMGVFDVDFDFAKAKMHLIAPSDCGDAVVYWTGDYAKVPISLEDTNGLEAFQSGKIRVNAGDAEVKHIYAHAQLDGQDIKVQFDTGSPVTIMRYSQAKFLLGLKDDDPRLKPIKNARQDGLPMYSYTFKTLAIGGINVNNPVLYIAGSPEERVDIAGPMLVGMDVLRKLHIYLSYQNRVMYVSPADAGAAPAKAN